MHALRLGMAASFERKLGRRPLELDDPSDVICRTFAIQFFLTRPLRMVPAGIFVHRALQIGPAILSTRSTTRATRKFLVRYLSLPPTPPARPAHHTSRADRFHTLRPPHRLAHVQTSRRTRLGTNARDKCRWRPCAPSEPRVARAGVFRRSIGTCEHARPGLFELYLSHGREHRRYVRGACAHDPNNVEGKEACD